VKLNNAQHRKVLRPNVSREQAVAAFNSSGLRRLSWIYDFRPLRSIADLYIPFRLYQVSIKHGNTVDTRWMAIDLIFGGLDPFSFEAFPCAEDMDGINNKNRPQPLLEDSVARQILKTKIQRVLFQTGFFRMRNLDIELQPAIEQLHMPYWVGFFGANEKASIQILDATRRVMEGGKLRRYVYEWLLS
jgi:hypothetical protein